MTLTEFRKLPFQYTTGFSSGLAAARLYRNNEHGLQIEIHTKRAVPGCIYSGWKKQRKYFYLDGDPAEYRTMTALWKAWKARGDK